jgi:hypothetical protein
MRKMTSNNKRTLDIPIPEDDPLEDMTGDDVVEDVPVSDDEKAMKVAQTSTTASARKKQRKEGGGSHVFDRIESFYKANKALPEVRGKKNALNIAVIEGLNKKLLNGFGGPNESAAHKKIQLEQHERLHLAFQDGSLDGANCLLALYLKVMEAPRRLQLRILNGDLTVNDAEKKSVTFPTNYAKFPPGTILADRGFAKDAVRYQNFITPHFMSGRSQLPHGELSTDLIICCLRYGCEVYFSRVTDETILADVIPATSFSNVVDAIQYSIVLKSKFPPLMRSSVLCRTLGRPVPKISGLSIAYLSIR